MIDLFWKRLDINSATLIGAGAVLPALLAAHAAPFGAGDIGFWSRVGFWSLVTGAGWLIVGGCLRFAEAHGCERRRYLRDLMAVCLITLLFAPVLWLLCGLWAIPVSGRFPGFAVMVQYGAIFACGILVLRRGIAAGAAPDPAPAPRILRRLPAGRDERIVRLTVRDHYVDIVTSARTYTLRMRFGDAIDEMEPVRGHCTHRSHWVVEDAISSVERHGGRVQLKLTNGNVVPVSRKYRPSLEAAGIL